MEDLLQIPLNNNLIVIKPWPKKPS
jgi:hypothetical protein